MGITTELMGATAAAVQKIIPIGYGAVKRETMYTTFVGIQQDTFEMERMTNCTSMEVFLSCDDFDLFKFFVDCSSSFTNSELLKAIEKQQTSCNTKTKTVTPFSRCFEFVGSENGKQRLMGRSWTRKTTSTEVVSVVSVVANKRYPIHLQ